MAAIAPLDGLAELWEASEPVRRRAFNEKALLMWPKPESTGVASYSAARLNAVVLLPFYTMWARSVATPKAPGVRVRQREVPG